MINTYNRENEYDKGAESKMYYREGHPHSAPNHQSSFSGNNNNLSRLKGHNSYRIYHTRLEIK
jgi:hypothetical protein